MCQSAPVAQLDRASPSEFYNPLFLVDLFLLKLLYFFPWEAHIFVGIITLCSRREFYHPS